MKKILIGKIVSDKMQKTVVVQIDRKVRHPLYQKLVKKTKKLKADTNNLNLVYGQIVKIEQTRPISKDKYFKVIEIIQEAVPEKISEDTLKKEEKVEEVKVVETVETKSEVVKEKKTRVKKEKTK